MPKGLLSLQMHCDQLDSDKVTERKKHIESLRRELNRSSIIQQLDTNSDNKRGLTWNAVFKALIAYMLKEIAHLKKQKGESSTSLSTKDRKKQTVGEVFKWFVRKANQRGEKLNCSDLLHHVLTLMTDDFLATAFGEVCCSVLQKDILRSRQYFCQIPSDEWQDLLKYFCKALRDPAQRVSHDVLSRIVSLILSGALTQSNVSTSFIFTFFNSIIVKFRTNERSATMVENILGSLNVFTLTYASDLRTQLCKLGEDSIDIFLLIWKKYSTPVVKEEVVEFLRMQMKLHHPKGVVTEEQGAYAEDFTVWRSHLKYLYKELVYNEWTKVNTRRKLKGVIGQEIICKEADVDLAADICHQILCRNDSAVGETTQGINLDFTQSPNSSRYISQGGGAAKRRKVDSLGCTWEILQDTISTQTSNFTQWLQLIQLILHKYPNSLPVDQLLPLISKVHQVQTESKTAEVQTWLLKTLQALAVCQSRLGNLPTGLVTALQTEWNKIWSCAIRTISLHSAECDGFDLLTCILHHGIVNPDKEHWRLFMVDSTPPTRSSVQFLATYLSCHSLPENHICKPGEAIVSRSAAVKGTYPLRHQLLNWLLPIEEQEETGERLIMTLLKSLPTILVAKVLGQLTQRTTQCRPQDPIHNSPPDPMRSKKEQTLEDVETLYLQSSFNKLVWQVTEDRSGSENDVKGGSSSVVLSVRQSLMKTLEIIGIQVLDFSGNEVNCFETLIHYASFLCKTLAWLIQLGVLSNQEIAQSKVTDSLKTLLKRVSAALRSLWRKIEIDNKIQIQSLESLIMTLDDMLTWDHSSSSQMVQDSARWLADTCRRSTPTELIDLLFEIIHKKGTNTVVSKSGPPKMAAKDPLDDLMDTDFDDEVRDNNPDEVDSFDMNSNLPDETDNQKDCLSLLSCDSLSESEQLALKAAQCLCSWSLTGVGKPHQEQQTGRSGLRPYNVQEKLLDLFDKDVWALCSAFDVQLFFLVADAFIAYDERPDEAHVNGLLYALKAVISRHRKDRELCAAAYSLFSRLIPFLHCDTEGVSQTLGQARGVALRLINAIWTLQRDGSYTPPERLAIAKCIHALVLIDPLGKWTNLRSKVQESGQGDTDLTAHSVMYMLVKDGGSHEVRMYMALAITCLFCHQSKDGTVSTPFTKDIQNQAFDKVYQAAQDAMEIKERLKTQELADQSGNRTASLLATLSTVARCSPACEKKTVFALMQIVTLNRINITLMKKVIQSISDSLYYTSVKVFMETHLSFLIHQWLLEKYSLSKFPYQLLGCHTEVDFYRNYHQVVVPHLVTMERIHTVQDIAKTLSTDWKQLLKDSFPQTIAHILPLFGHTGAAEEDIDNEDYQERRSGARKGLAALEGILGKETIDSLIQVNLDQIVVELLAMLYEPHSAGSRDGTQFTSDKDPEPNPPFFTCYTIKATLDYLTTCHAGSKALTLVTLLAKTQDNIQKILLSLHIKISKSHRCHEKHRILLAYRLFISLLLAELPTGLGGSWAMVLQDVIYTLVHSLQEGQELGKGLEPGEGERLCGLCVDLLHNVCMTALGCCPEELGKHLCVMIGALVPLIETDDAISNQALSLINLLVIDNADKLAPALKLLDPFPDSAKLAPARTAQQAVKYAAGEFTLMEEVQHFLKVGKQGGVLRLEGLRHLHHQLATKKEELAIMVQQCAEGCDRTIIHLLTELVKISGTGDHILRSKDNVSQSLKEEAGRCLGDIGAPNLSTVALHCDEAETDASYTTALRVFANDPIMSRHVVIIHLLQQYLSDPKVDIVEAAANCLKTVLATNAGQRCHETYKKKQIDNLFNYLQPFRPSKRKTTYKPALQPSATAFEQTIGDPLLWQPVSNNHGDWVRNLTVALIRSGGVKDEILLQLEPICTVKVEFAERVLPYLFHDILSSGIDTYRQVLSQGVEAVFSNHCHSTSNSRAPTPVTFHGVSSSQLGHRSIRTLLDVMYYLRTQERPTGGRSKSTAWDNNFWLDINYLLAAKAAQNCRAHFTCLLYTEIWCDVQRSQQGTIGLSRSSSHSLSLASDIESLSILTNESDINMQSLLLEAYSSIGEPDGVYGCGAGRLTDTQARIHTYEHEGDWDKALAAYDLKLHSKSTHTGQEEIGILQAMQNKGLSHILNVYLHGLQSEHVVFGPEMAEFQYEAAWRNGQWDQELDHRNQTGYHQSIFTALSCLRDDEEESFQMALQHARLDTIKQLCNASMESAYSVYPMLSRLQGLAEIEDFGCVLLENSQPMSVLDSWSSQLTLMDNDFEFCEPTLALRTVLLQLLLEKTNETFLVQQAYEGLVKHLKNYTQLARKAERFQIAEKALVTLQCLERPSDIQSDPSWWRLIEEAKVYWTRNEKTTAMHLIQALLDKIKRTQTQDPVAESLHPEVLTIVGNWLAETCSESPNAIIDKYMEKAVYIYDARNDTRAPAIKAHLSLARFADSQYQNIVNYTKSSEYEAKENLLKQAKKDCEELRAIGGKSSTSDSKYIRTLDKQSEIDELELGSMMDDRENFLQKAIECYLKCLQYGNQDHDMRVFRVCSLWFDNSSDDYLNQLMQESCEKIESRKFLPMLYQLAARMTTKTQDKQMFYEVLNELIEKMARDHPHHALPIILALANANKDAIITAKTTGRLARTTSSVKESDTSHADQARMQAAKGMLERLRSTPSIGDIITGLERLSDAYIKLAYWDVSDRKKETGAIQLPSSQPLTQLKHLQHVAMPTMEIPVNANCCYNNITWIEGFEGTFKLAGGINLPKIITCIGSDGIKRRQLVKGKDDLRQDAVMQQVFSLVNKLLQRNQETRKRRLQIRTYKIVPLSQRSGLLEWCEGTMPIGQYLIGNQGNVPGAHKRYRPQDWTAIECRSKMAHAHKSSEQGKKYNEYVAVMAHFKPVFRHFFLEKFPDPAVWLERRLAYTRSVATSSIVGYVVGLGDRHVQNILIDCNLAELVHIDLGVAFEQGRILPTPETIPFRLTRDLVDGMGIAGVEGVFRRCCEKTMDVMHNSQEALLTILQVLLYDPLYIWTMSPHKAIALQQHRDRNDPEASDLNTTSTDLPDGETTFKGQDSNDGSEVNKVAERVVLRLRQKLQGVEEGVAMSVKGQVNRLIQEATDPKNLCRVFPGWQPWL